AFHVPSHAPDHAPAHALALPLARSRKLARCDRAVRAGEWPGYDELAPLHRLRGRTLGLLGYGRIARSLAAKAEALGLRALAHEPYVAEATATREQLFREADFLSLHVPLTEENRGSVAA